MANKNNCKPSKKVSKAGTDLSTSNSNKVKSDAAKTLVNHKTKKHKK